MYFDHVLGYSGVNLRDRTLQDNLGLATGSQFTHDMSSAGSQVNLIVTLTQDGRQHLKSVRDRLCNLQEQFTNI